MGVQVRRSPGTQVTIAVISLVFCAVAISGCSRSTPTGTVKDYLRLLSGERDVTQSALQSVTTEHYRNAEHAHLATLTCERRAQAIDLAEELREDPAIREFLERVKWTTTYEVSREGETSAEVVARVIISERRAGDREAVLEIPDLPAPLREVLESGLELPFRFELMKEDGVWKIDGLVYPEALVSLLELPGVTQAGDE